MTAKKKGRVKWFNAVKGYGFIAPDDGGEDVFVHITAVISAGSRTLSEGQRVLYAPDIGENGRTFACELELID